MPDPWPTDPAEFAQVVRFGPYEIPVDPITGERQELGRGAMGVAYKARHFKLGRLVVLKVVQPGALQGEKEVAELMRLRF